MSRFLGANVFFEHGAPVISQGLEGVNRGWSLGGNGPKQMGTPGWAGDGGIWV